MKSTSSSAPTLELGPRMGVNAEQRGCGGCAHYGEGFCNVNYPQGKEVPFWVYTARPSNAVGPNEGFSCALWETRNET